MALFNMGGGPIFVYWIKITYSVGSKFMIINFFLWNIQKIAFSWVLEFVDINSHENNKNWHSRNVKPIIV